MIVDDAVAKLSSRPFDFVLCDLLLPGRSGIELFHHARTTMIDVDARFVFMTGAIASAAVLEFLETVPNERIEKPFDGTTLLAAFAHTQEMRKERESCTVADGLRSKSG